MPSRLAGVLRPAGPAGWSETVVVNDDDPAVLHGQFNPNISVAPDGRLDLVWWDQRDWAGAFGVDVYYASSSDSGATRPRRTSA